MERINRTGESWITNEGYKTTIIEYFNWGNCTIQFEDGKIYKNVNYGNLKKGTVNNPYHLSVYEVGYFGEGIYSRKVYPKIYDIWHNMLERCYSEKYKEKRPTYNGCSVLKEWYNFQNFAAWYEENCVKDYHVDKDILIKGNKIYSPTTCCFVPLEINNLFTKTDKLRGEYPIGVNKRGNRFIARICSIRGRISLGSFSTPEEAFLAYKKAKEGYIKEVAEKYKNKITEACYQALINYQVNIND